MTNKKDPPAAPKGYAACQVCLINCYFDKKKQDWVIKGCEYCNRRGFVLAGLSQEKGEMALRRRYFLEREEAQQSARGAVRKGMPYTKKVTESKAGLKRAMVDLFALVKEYRSIERLGLMSESAGREHHRLMGQIMAIRIMRQWWRCASMASWTTKDGNVASDVILGEALAYFEAGSTTDDYHAVEDGDSGIMGDEKEQYKAYLVEAQAQVKREIGTHMEVLSTLGVEHLAADEETKWIEKTVDMEVTRFHREEKALVKRKRDQIDKLMDGWRAFDRYTGGKRKLSKEEAIKRVSVRGLKVVTSDPAGQIAAIERQIKEIRLGKMGTINEMARVKRKMYERVDALNAVVDDVRKGKLPIQTLIPWYRHMMMIRTKVLNKSFDAGDVKSHLTIEANAILDDLQLVEFWRMHITVISVKPARNHKSITTEALSSLKMMKPLREYDATKAGEKHKSSSWVKDTGTKDMGKLATVEYKDLSGSDSNPEEAMMQYEAYLEGELPYDMID